MITQEERQLGRSKTGIRREWRHARSRVGVSRSTTPLLSTTTQEILAAIG